jgi:serine/threonine protein kinase/outer membrane protein assembly factor BamB
VEPLQPGDPGRMGGYRLLARLGAGGMGVVYLGRSPGGRTVAVKVVRERFAGDAEYRARFRREVSAARTVTGAFTAPVLDADPEASSPWLVTAYLPGLTLLQAVGTFGGLPASAVRVLAAGLAEALADIHRTGLAHRDLKPANIMLTGAGPRVVDFGIARPEDATAITRVGAVIGTPGFMSPEQARGDVAGPAGDVFSFGSVLVFAATGKEPFDGGATVDTLRRVEQARPDLDAVADRDLRDLLTDCLRREPGQRPTATELLDRLSGDGTSVQGTRWLPPPLAEAIDLRTAEARRLPGSVLDTGTESTRHSALTSAVMGGETLEPPVTPAGQRGLSRRNLIIAGAATLAAAGGVTAWALSRTSEPQAENTPPPRTTPSSPPAAPPAPPLAVQQWKVKVGDDYPNLFSAGGLVLARDTSDVRGLDPSTGAIRWTLPTTLLGTVSNGVVYVAGNSNPLLTAVDPASGATRWMYRVLFPEAPVWLADNGSVICFGDEDKIRALGSGDGKTRWTATADAKRSLTAAPGIIAAADTSLVALDDANGRTKWTYAIDIGYVQPRFGSGLFFLTDNSGDLHAVHADSGTRAWTSPVGSWTATMLVDADRVYIVGDGGTVFAVKIATGETVWSHRLGNNEGASYGQSNSLGLSGDTVYVGCTDRNVYALSAADGRTRWTYGADSTLTANGPVSVAGLVFVGTKDGYVEALAPPKGGMRAGS